MKLFDHLETASCAGGIVPNPASDPRNGTDIQMRGLLSSLITLPHRDIGQFDMAAESFGVEQGKGGAILCKPFPDAGKGSRRGGEP